MHPTGVARRRVGAAGAIIGRHITRRHGGGCKSLADHACDPSGPTKCADKFLKIIDQRKRGQVQRKTLLHSLFREVQAAVIHRFPFLAATHHLASLLIASGADIKTVQARMRHASAKTTLDTYGHLWPDADESTRSAIGELISERMESVEPTADPLRTRGTRRRHRRRSAR